MKVLDLINIGSEKLKLSEVHTYRLDSEILLSKVLGKSREKLLINLEKDINLSQISQYKTLIKRRSLKEPIAYIIGQKEFWSKTFEVNSDTLIPRPETELMVEKLVSIYKNKRVSFLDIGTGSGCISISLISELNNCRGLGIDISKNAITIAKKNADKHNISRSLKLINKSFLHIFNQKFDLVVSNPPYIKTKDIKNLDKGIKNFEPKIALDGGKDGLDVIKKVIYKSLQILRLNGTLALEIGNNQYNKISKILKNNKFKIKYCIKDYKDNIRCIISTLVEKK
tara:strand:+ start:3646 stop:4494 length:849 start_codon:yes stop_codon:yes gene_type:complete